VILFSSYNFIIFDEVYTTESDIIVGAETSSKGIKLVHKFLGSIENVVIFDTAFTADEIQNLHNDELFQVITKDESGINVFDLSQGTISNGDPVDWILDVTFESESSKAAFDLPVDAEITSVQIATVDTTIINFDSTDEGIAIADGVNFEDAKNWKILDPTKTKNIINQVKRIIKYSRIFFIQCCIINWA